MTTALRDAQGRRLAYTLDERPRVSAHDGVLRAEAIKAEIVAARAAVSAGEQVAACPAARTLGVGKDGVTIRCCVERSLVSERENPSSLLNFCLRDASDPSGGYTRCPTWRAEKEREAHGTRSPLVAESEGV